MSILPLLVLAVAALVVRWLIRTARVTADDVADELKGPTAGAHLPVINADVRDSVVPRSQALDADTEQYRNLMPGGGFSGG